MLFAPLRIKKEEYDRHLKLCDLKEEKAWHS